MELYNDQLNAQVFKFILFICLLLPYMLRAFFYPIFRGKRTTSAVVQVSWVWCQRLGADTLPLNHCRSCTPASEDELKETPKHGRQK
jgi:hypothetical protein